MNIDRNTRISRTSAPVETTVGSETILMVLETGKCFGLGETGSGVWRLLVQPTTVTAIVDALLLEYDAPASIIEGDVLELLSQLHDEGLVEVA